MHYIAYFTVLIIHLAACAAGKQKLRRISKHFLLPMLFLAYIMQGGTEIAVMLGLLFGWTGDIILMKTDSPKRCICGSFFFGAGHACYLYALLFGFWRVPFSWQLIVFPLLCTVITLIVYGLIREPVAKELKTPSLMYFILLGIMTGVCAAAAINDSLYGSVAGIAGLLGYVFFIFSDTMLLKQWSSVGDPHPPTDFKVMLTYGLAQFLIILGFTI